MGLLWNHNVTPGKLADVNCGLLKCSETGSVDWPRTLWLARQATDQGITRALVVAGASTIDSVRRRLPQLASLLAGNGIELEVKAAVEMSLETDLFDRVVRTSTLLGGLHRRYVLLRVPPENRMPIAPVVESIKRMNLSTILIAPERSLWLRSHPTEWQRMTSAGALIQISAASLLDRTDLARVRFCRSLIRAGRCHFVASETGRHHDMPISLADAFTTIAKWAGEETAAQLCRGNADRLFDDMPIEPTVTKQPRIRRWLA